MALAVLIFSEDFAYNMYSNPTNILFCHGTMKMLQLLSITNWGDDQLVFLSFSDGINSGAVSSSPETSFEAFEAKGGAIDFEGCCGFPPIDLWIKKFLDPAMFSFSAEFVSVRRASVLFVQLREEGIFYFSNSFWPRYSFERSYNPICWIWDFSPKLAIHPRKLEFCIRASKEATWRPPGGYPEATQRPSRWGQKLL